MVTDALASFFCIFRVTLVVVNGNSFVPPPPTAGWQEIVKYSALPCCTGMDDVSVRKKRPSTLIPYRQGLDVSFS